jgi:hypothetical protein
MAELGSWTQIRRHGLLSTSTLLDLYEYSGARRTAIESKLRKANIEIEHPKNGMAVVRDQCPMYESGLIRCLQDGLTPTQWLHILNERVFFWVSRDRLHGLLNAANYAALEHDVLILDTASVMEDYVDIIALCPMNSGATRPFPHPRGKSTFSSFAKYPWDERKKKKGKNGELVVELTVLGGVYDIDKHIVEVHQMKGSKIRRTILQNAK